MAFEPSALWSAWTACRSVREEQFFSDPLLHAEFEIADVPPGSDVTPERVEVDVRTRPKQSGGVRTELFGSPKTGVGGLRSNRWAPPRVATGRAACQRAARALRSRFGPAG